MITKPLVHRSNDEHFQSTPDCLSTIPGELLQRLLAVECGQHFEVELVRLGLQQPQAPEQAMVDLLRRRKTSKLSLGQKSSTVQYPIRDTARQLQISSQLLKLSSCRESRFINDK